MAERPTYKLRFLDPKKRFPAMPEQPAGRSYGVVWKLFGEDPHESCYVVEFVGKSHVSLLGYVCVSGEVYKVDRPVNEASLPDDPDMQLILDESDSNIGEIAVRGTDGTMYFPGASHRLSRRHHARTIRSRDVEFDAQPSLRRVHGLDVLALRGICRF